MSRRTAFLAAATAALLATFTTPATAHDEPVAGSLVGAGIGAAVAGPPGAAVGAVIGAAIGATVAHDTDHGRNGHRHTRRTVRGHGNVNGNGTSALACEYRPRIVHRDDRVRYVPAATKTKLKKVCRYVRVRVDGTGARVSPAG